MISLLWFVRSQCIRCSLLHVELLFYMLSSVAFCIFYMFAFSEVCLSTPCKSYTFFTSQWINLFTSISH